MAAGSMEAMEFRAETRTFRLKGDASAFDV
jgi:hypothetical protein